MRRFGLRRRKVGMINPDETFIDEHNLPSFSRGRFEGRLEAPIHKRVLLGLFAAGAVLLALLSVRLAMLQIVEGTTYAAISDYNRLDRAPLFAARGVIYDRNGIELAWNVPLSKEATSSLSHGLPAGRAYYQHPGFAHVLGYVTLPRADASGNYYRTAVEGVAGIEKTMNAVLAGVNGSRIEETDAMGKRVSENVIEPPVDGTQVTLTIDARLQETLFTAIAETAHASGFIGGAGVIVDVTNGELLALTSYPEFDPSVMAAATNSAAIASYQDSDRAPFLDRPIAGLFVPGSIVKPFVALAALTEGVISPQKEIESTGVLRVPNPFMPGRYSTFVDWRAHGFVDMRRAIAVSSDIYFYQIAGGYGSQRGIGIANIEKYSRLFGIAEKTGIPIEGEKEGTIPNPEWKQATFNDLWRLGDTYNTSIGQYGFLVTPLSMARATAALASRGELATPSLVSGSASGSTRIEGISDASYQVVHEGMRLAVTDGTAAALNLPMVTVAAKTGTAQVGAQNQFVNSWVIGFYPFEKPRYAFAVMLERAPEGPPQGAPAAMRRFLEAIAQTAPEMLAGAP